MSNGEGPSPGRRRRPVWLVLGAVLLVVVIALLSGTQRHHRPLKPRHPGVAGSPPVAAGPAALPAPAAPLLGISVNRLFLDRTYSPAQVDAQLTALARTGATDARCDALWEAAEQQPPTRETHSYDWRFDDRIASALARHGLRWLPIIDYTASWAQSIPGQDHSAPRSAAAYAAYAGAFAARYGPGGSFWAEHPTLPAQPMNTFEIWNEPDGGHFWLPGPDPHGYASLYAAARAAIKTVDPAARVLIGGLTNPSGFLPAVLAARLDLRGRIDGVAVHPYAGTPAAVLNVLKTDRTLLRSLGLPRVPLYVTEFGWTPRPRGARDWLPARLRRAYIRQSLAALGHMDCGVSGVFLYTWVTPERDPANGEDWFGIHPPNGGDTPATQGFADGIRLARGPRATLPICGPSG